MPTRNETPARARDLRAFVTDTVISLEERAPSAEDMARRIRETDEDSSLARRRGRERGDRLRLRRFSPHARQLPLGDRRRRLRLAREPAPRRRASAVRDAASALVAQGLRIACAGVTLPNDASVGLHEALGFRPIGVYGNIGFKRGGVARRRLVAARARRPQRVPTRTRTAARTAPANRASASSRRAAAPASGTRRAARRANPTSSGGTSDSIEDRVAPVVEPDQLGQQLGAQAVGLAHDRVDPQRALIAGTLTPELSVPESSRRRAF